MQQLSKAENRSLLSGVSKALPGLFSLKCLAEGGRIFGNEGRVVTVTNDGEVKVGGKDVVARFQHQEAAKSALKQVGFHESENGWQIPPDETRRLF